MGYKLKFQYPEGQRPDILEKILLPPGDLLEVVDPKLTVITASYNLGKFLDPTIKSVLNQSFRNFEHVVIDGASTDDSVEILKKYPHIKFVSEKDSGYPEAFRKGMQKAKGEYITQCAVSDGYASTDWFKEAVEALDSNPEISLVWGLPQYLTEDGTAGAIAYSEYLSKPAPSKEDFFVYWLASAAGFPEGNLVVRKKVLNQCYPEGDLYNIVDWNEFTYNFNSKGYLSLFLPIVANFGRTHEGQMGQSELREGKLQVKTENYNKLVAEYRKKVLFGKINPKFISGAGSIVQTQLSAKQAFLGFINYRLTGLINLIKYKVKKIFKYGINFFHPISHK